MISLYNLDGKNSSLIFNNSMFGTTEDIINSFKYHISQYQAIAEGRPPFGNNRSSNSTEPKHPASALKVQTIKLKVRDEAEDIEFLKFVEEQEKLYKSQAGYQRYSGYEQIEGEIKDYRDREDRDETPSSQSFILAHRQYTDNYPYVLQPQTIHIVQQYEEDQLAQQENWMDDQEQFNKFYKKQYDQYQYLQPPKADKQSSSSSQKCKKKGRDDGDNKLCSDNLHNG